jgi:hypothetical protein
MLIGRQNEQKRLLMAEASKKSEFVAVFGRRRVGKTFLIRETFKNRFCFYHTGLANAGMARQLTEFKKTLCKYGNKRFRVPKDWALMNGRMCRSLRSGAFGAGWHLNGSVFSILSKSRMRSA